MPAAILPVANRLAHSTALVSTDEPCDVTVPKHLAVKGTGIFARSYSALNTFAPDIVHTHGLWSGLSMSALRYGKRTGAKLVVSPHGMLDPWALKRGHLKKMVALNLFERRHMNKSVFVHALNKQEASSVRAAGVNCPIAIVPNGVDLPQNGSQPKPDWMDRPTLLFLGRLHAKKGVTELIDAFAKCGATLPDWQLAIAGWDDGPNIFRDHARRSGAPIVFPGPLFGKEKVAAYSHCAAFILPSYSEGLPMTVLEAWSHEKPVLMTDACNLPEGFATGAAVRITTDPREMSITLSHRLQDRDFLQSAGRAGRRLVIERFSWDAITARFEALYDFILTGKQTSDELFYDMGDHHVA